MKVGTLAVALGMLVVAGAAEAQKVYKCADERGRTAYQETPCATEAQTKSVRSYKRAPVAPSTNYDSQAAGFEFAGDAPLPAQPQRQAAQQPAFQPRRFDPNPMSNDAEAIRRMEIMATTREGRAMLRQMSGQQLPRAPAPAPAPDPNQGIGLPVRVIDPQTSMPIEGAIKVAPNRIWDPKTGEYRWTTP